ncbi:site-specific integrase [Pseudomonas solani]|uniref:tyrosine-type recombinase/integrase n=1 Tax=Pseudomonas solani TaxID=2731552 RepID=UPI0035BE3A67
MTARTERVTFSDAQIRTLAASGDVRELRDDRHQALRFRFSTDRQSGTWWVVIGRTWSKLGRWPGLSTKSALVAMPTALERLAVDRKAAVASSSWGSVGDHLRWQADRTKGNRALSTKRRDDVEAIIRNHLLPALGDLPLADLNADSVDRRLIWPLMESLSVAYVRQILRVLLAGLRQAVKLKLLLANPLEGVKFSDFVAKRVKSKPARLHAMMLAELLARLADRFEEAPRDVMLAVLMLVHGTRVGETRLGRWRHFSLTERVWMIPAANTKTAAEHELPLTDQVVALLVRYRALQVATIGPQDYLFPGNEGQPLSARQATAVFASLGQGEWTSHDLRKVARTSWTDLGVDYLVGELLVNHALPDMATTYIKTHARKLQRDALELWCAWLDERGFPAIHGKTEVSAADSENGLKASDDAVDTKIPLPTQRRGKEVQEGGTQP